MIGALLVTAAPWSLVIGVIAGIAAVPALLILLVALERRLR